MTSLITFVALSEDFFLINSQNGQEEAQQNSLNQFLSQLFEWDSSYFPVTMVFYK